MKPLKILFWDIETSHNQVALFSLRNQDYVHYSNILQERYIICGAWKWLGDRTVHSATSRAGHDAALCTRLARVLASADIVVHHNGDKFDLPFLEGRLLYHGKKPIIRPRSVDTLKVARRRFALNSARLDYLGQYLRVGRKAPHDSGLWLQVLHGNAQALKRMVHYNRQDVRLLEAVFKRLKPYIGELMPPSEGTRCGSCGGHTQSAGWRTTVARRYQRRRCLTCGHTMMANKPEPGRRTCRSY